MNDRNKATLKLLLGQCCCPDEAPARPRQPQRPAVHGRPQQRRPPQAAEDTPFIPPQPYTRTLPQLAISPQWLQRGGTGWTYAPDRFGQMRYNRAPLARHDLGVRDNRTGERLTLTFSAQEQIEGLGLDVRIGSIASIASQADDPEFLPDVTWTSDRAGVAGMGWAESWDGADDSTDRADWINLRRVRFRAPLPGQGGTWDLEDIPPITTLPAVGQGTERRGFAFRFAGSRFTLYGQGTYSGAGLDRRTDEQGVIEPESQWRAREVTCTLGGEAVIDVWNGDSFDRRVIPLPPATFTCTPFGFRLTEQARADDAAFFILPARMTETGFSGEVLRLKIGPGGAETWITLPAAPATRETVTVPLTRVKRLADGGLILHVPTLGVGTRDATYAANGKPFLVDGVADGLLQVRAAQVNPDLLAALRDLTGDPQRGLTVTRTVHLPPQTDGSDWRLYARPPTVQATEFPLPFTPDPGTLASGRPRDLPMNADTVPRGGLTLRQPDGTPFGGVQFDLSALPFTPRRLNFTDITYLPFASRTPVRDSDALLGGLGTRRVLTTRALSLLFRP